MNRFALVNEAGKIRVILEIAEGGNWEAPEGHTLRPWPKDGPDLLIDPFAIDEDLPLWAEVMASMPKTHEGLSVAEVRARLNDFAKNTQTAEVAAALATRTLGGTVTAAMKDPVAAYLDDLKAVIAEANSLCARIEAGELILPEDCPDWAR